MNWLEDAIEFDIYLGSKLPQVKDVTDHLVKEISRKIAMRNKPRSKETLKLALLNLWVAYHSGVAVYYSRNPNDYLSSRRYGMLHVKYHRLIPIVDTLEDMGLIKQKKGWFDREKNMGRQTRMYATDNLVNIFKDIAADGHEVIEKLPPRESIQLKDERKRLTDYQETEDTVCMRRNLHHYNDFIRQQHVSIQIPHDCPVNIRFLTQLNHNQLKGVVSIDNIEIPHPNLKTDLTNILTYNNNLVIHQATPYSYLLHYIQDILDTTSHTHYSIFYDILSTMTNKVRDMEDRKDREAKMSNKIALSHFGIRRLNYELKYEVLHRTFNKSSFNLGGRFFGAYHTRMMKQARPHILINGKPTVELDYSAHHIRMLYHLEGIDYKDDPYAVVCDREEERPLFKLVQLIAINAANEKKATMAIRNEFRKDGIGYDLTDKSIGRLLCKFMDAHQPVGKYLNSGIGLTLQNKDSQITEAILMSLLKKGIACLPVHDSYVVEETYKDVLLENMTEEYEKIMNFKPVIS